MQDFSANVCSTHYAHYLSEKEKCFAFIVIYAPFSSFHAMYFGLDKIDAF